MSTGEARRALFRASPAGRLEAHHANLQALAAESGESIERYRQWVEVAANRIEQGLSGEALQYLSRADHALSNLSHEWDDDRIRGVKVGMGLKSAALQTNALFRDQRLNRFARMSELVPVLSVDSAAAQCECEGLGGREAIKRQWNRNRYREKRDT